MSKKTDGGFTALNASTMTSSTAAISSMNTPALLICDMSLTPKAFTAVVKAMKIAPQMTALIAKSFSPVPSPTSWKPDHSCGSVTSAARTTAASVTTDAVNIIQPASHDTVGPASRLDQL